MNRLKSIKMKVGQKSSDSRIPKPPKPPEKPLMPYMRYSRKVWESVKNSNPQSKLWEVGKIIGQMWRELPENEKSHFVDEYETEKIQYNDALRLYHNSTAYKSWLSHKERMEKTVDEPDNIDGGFQNQKDRYVKDSHLIETRESYILEDNDEDPDEIYTIKHVASHRYQRNQKLMLELFSDYKLPELGLLVTETRLNALGQQVEGLQNHKRKLVEEIEEFQRSHENKKFKIKSESEKFWDDYKKELDARPVITEKMFTDMVKKAREDIIREEKERENAIKSKLLVLENKSVPPPPTSQPPTSDNKPVETDKTKLLTTTNQKSQETIKTNPNPDLNINSQKLTSDQNVTNTISKVMNMTSNQIPVSSTPSTLSSATSSANNNTISSMNYSTNQNSPRQSGAIQQNKPLLSANINYDSESKQSHLKNLVEFSSNADKDLSFKKELSCNNCGNSTPQLPSCRSLSESSPCPSNISSNSKAPVLSPAEIETDLLVPPLPTQSVTPQFHHQQSVKPTSYLDHASNISNLITESPMTQNQHIILNSSQQTPTMQSPNRKPVGGSGTTKKPRSKTAASKVKSSSSTNSIELESVSSCDRRTPDSLVANISNPNNTSSAASNSSSSSGGGGGGGGGSGNISINQLSQNPNTNLSTTSVPSSSVASSLVPASSSSLAMTPHQQQHPYHTLDSTNSITNNYPPTQQLSSSVSLHQQIPSSHPPAQVLNSTMPSQPPLQSIYPYHYYHPQQMMAHPRGPGGNAGSPYGAYQTGPYIQTANYYGQMSQPYRPMHSHAEMTMTQYGPIPNKPMQHPVGYPSGPSMYGGHTNYPAAYGMPHYPPPQGSLPPPPPQGNAAFMQVPNVTSSHQPLPPQQQIPLQHPPSSTTASLSESHNVTQSASKDTLSNCSTTATTNIPLDEANKFSVSSNPQTTVSGAVSTSLNQVSNIPNAIPQSGNLNNMTNSTTASINNNNNIIPSPLVSHPTTGGVPMYPSQYPGLPYTNAVAQHQQHHQVPPQQYPHYFYYPPPPHQPGHNPLMAPPPSAVGPPQTNNPSEYPPYWSSAGYPMMSSGNVTSNVPPPSANTVQASGNVTSTTTNPSTTSNTTNVAQIPCSVPSTQSAVNNISTTLGSNSNETDYHSNESQTQKSVQE